MASLRGMLFWFTILYILYLYFGIPVKFAFRVKTVKEVAATSSGMLYSEKKLRASLQDYFPDLILNQNLFPWVPFNSGGLRGSVSVLYMSFTEFMVLYHAPMNTVGSTGRHFMNISSTVLHGEMAYVADAGELHKAFKLYAGQNYVLRAGQSATVRLNAGTTLLVYGRGIVPLTMGYWISDTLFVDHDPLLAITTILMFLKGWIFSYGTPLFVLGQIFFRVLAWSSQLVEHLAIIPETFSDLYKSSVNYVNSLLKI